MSEILTRSSAHWSEAGRKGMEAFYHLATDDYRHLALARNWVDFFEAAQAKVGDRSLRLLDVACGSGKFPSALAQHGNLQTAKIAPIETALLDPSAFSIAEARAALPAPFQCHGEYETTLQAFDPPTGGFDIVWATHALYAIPRSELAPALAQFRAAIAPGGHGIIAHSAEAGHYISFHGHYLSAFDTPGVEQYVPAELIADTLRRTGADVSVEEVIYDSVADGDATEAVEGYLRRCVFDDTISLIQMQKTEPLASYLAHSRDAAGWRFGQRVWLLTITG
ncbi:bifunctional 2-polyprenyl-6-hydroxyphenol methylase/3-demethylubiquinol 3-O-methyltransferase UbiG [Actibacterium sp. 188UL27-1]|uniref:class I SAM-dependent methyltransferase n=1 Tax=Actibacterium sp. 188UL27-1 TaxID=2786961 RepID=UPI00195CACA3|nr:class I SAM-dependent methyltransferase [Actibacterium sp. 188UL27-1]MBM7068999.1 class I SAM-dependent methyltransferase [Actibacterium sp. 188UL27-1]